MFNNSPLPCLQSHAAGLGYYQVGGDVNRIMELYRDAHSFEVTLASLPLDNDAFLAFEAGGGLAGSVLGSLHGIEAYNNALDGGAANGHGFTKRVIKQSQYIADSSEKQPPRDATTVCGDYPFHTYTNGQVSVVVDFGKTINMGGLFYPYITIQMSNGISSINGANTIGNIDFASIGPIVLYGDSFGFAFGSLKVGERYSDIAMSSYSCAQNETITLQAKNGKKFSGFKDITEVFIGNSSAQFQKSNTSITVTVPSTATSDYITFLTKDNKFFSPEMLRITRS